MMILLKSVTPYRGQDDSVFVHQMTQRAVEKWGWTTIASCHDRAGRNI